MPAATGNPASLNPTGGIGIIFRGSDTWHFGNSSASPYTGGSWTWSWNGTSGNPNYIGVDQTWFSGSSWVRPILTWDNPATTSTSLSSCSYPSGDMFDGGGVGNYIFDNFEMTGICTTASNWSPIYVSYNETSAGTFYYNLYIHGWSHVQFTVAGNCDINSQCMSAFRGFPTGYTLGPSAPGDVLLFDVVDGSDSDPVQQEFMYGGAWDIAYSYFNDGGQFITRTQHIFHDNTINNFVNSGHSNIMESVGPDQASPANAYAIYNNLFENLYLSGPTTNVGFWPIPPVGATLYWFNNVVWNAGPMELFNGPNSYNQGTTSRFNDTFQNISGGGNDISCGVSPYSAPYADANIHFISSDVSGIYSSSCSGQGTAATNILMTNAAATSAGYTSSQTYVYSPTSGSSPTVGAGTNLIAAFCNALSSAAGTDSTLSNAASACQADTTYGGGKYNSATHTVTGAARVTTTRPSSGAWDIGAYQFNGAPPPAAPVASVSPATLAFGNQATSTTGGPLTVTLSNTGNASLIIASIISSSGEFTKASDQCQTTFSYSLPQGQSCTVTVTFAPNALGAQNGVLTFTDNSGGTLGSQQTVALTGTGTSPGLWTSASSTTNFTVSWSSGTTQSCAVTKTLTASQPALLAYWGWAQGTVPTVNGVSGDSFTNAIFAPPQPPPGGGKYMISGIAEEPSATGGSTTATITLNTPSPIVGSLDCDLVQPIIATGTAILDGVASVGYQGCTGAVPCVSPTVALSGNDYVIVVGAKGNPAPTAPAAPWTTPADIDTGTNQYGGAFGALNQSVYSGFTFGGVSSTDYESISALSFGQSAALTVAVSPSGSGTLSCSSGNYPNGKAITCVATPGSGYGTPTWSGVSGCSGVSCTFNMNGPTSVTAVFPAVTYTLTQVISPVSSGYVAGPNCNTGSYTSGTTIGPCTATPAASYAFAGWSGGGCSGTSTCTVASLSANTTLTATFTPTGGGSYTWMPTISPVASGTLAGTHCAAGTYTSGTTIGACTATPATGYAFDDWSSVSGSAGCSGATNPCASFVISANSAATANFTQTSYTLGATTSGTGSGTATPSSTSLHYGDAYTITVTPASGSVVDSVTGCGVSSQSPYTGTMPAATCSVQVVFDVESFSWTPLILPPGSGSITGTNSVGGTYVSGTDIGALTPTPSTGYIFSSWTAVTGSADCSGSTTPCVQFALDANSTATANFTPVNSTISVSIPGGGGTVTGCAGSHAYGSIYSCAATPAANYYLQSISGCGGGGSTTYSGATPATDCNIIATFGVAQTGSTSSQTLEAQ
jgi:hypothetical protein